jgi:DNA-binding transcriptional regulator YiaG
MESLEEPIFSALASSRLICENGIPMPKPLSPVIQRLKEWRAKNNLSQAQALTVFKEGSLPVTLDSLQNWETGRNSPSPLAAAALADFLNRHQKVTPPASPKRKRRQ